MMAAILLPTVQATEVVYKTNALPEDSKTKIVDPALAEADQQAAATAAATVAEMPMDAAINDIEEPKSEAVGLLVDVNVGTLGAGISIGYEFNKYFKTRLRAAYLGYDYSDTWSDVDMTVDFSGNNGGIMFDYHPFGGTFRLTAGLTISDLAIQAKGSLNSDGPNYDGCYHNFGGYDFKVNNTTSAKIEGEYKWNRVQPYLGIGWSSDGEGDASFYFTCDIGINFIGSADFETSYSGASVSYKPTGAPDSQYKALENSVLHDAIKKEGKDFFEIADDICIYPVIQLGVGYRF